MLVRPGPESRAWDELARSLGLVGAAEGERRQTSGSGVPRLAGTVARTGKGKNVHEIVLRLDEPAPGVAVLGVYSWGGQVHASINFYLFGSRAPAVAASEEPVWRAWMNEKFPAAGGESNVA